MKFYNRNEELDRLNRLARRKQGGLAVVFGRRRIGKTRLLLEWTAGNRGLYTVADQSTPDVQRRYLAEAIAARLPGFHEVDYRDWHSLLDRLAREAAAAGWRGPIVFDEFPYLVLAAPELPSVVQRWLDHEAKRAGLAVAIAGSSQRMMQGLVLSSEAPLYGRARELLEIRPLHPRFLRATLRCRSAIDLVESYTAWGGVPRYWELAADEGGSVRSQVDRLVLDPLGPLHREPDRLLLEEVPSAHEVRPLLDAIGAGAHRVSEIAGRIGRPATSMSRPIDRLIGMGLARREIPFGESERKSKRSLYRIDDPFFRLWFRVVAPHRGQLATSSKAGRRQWLERQFNTLTAQAWEDLCRIHLPGVRKASRIGKLGPWGPASRWWKANLPEWDVVSLSLDDRRLLLGEVKWSRRRFDKAALERAVRSVAAKPPPSLPSRYERYEVVRALFVPSLVARVARQMSGVEIVSGDDVLC